jgi:hypothetical protein
MTRVTEAASVKQFEDCPEKLFIFRNGFHVVRAAEEERQGRGLVLVEFVDDLLEGFQIPYIIYTLHPPQRLVSPSTTD